MTITEYMSNNVVYLDGGLGTLLQKKGIKSGEEIEKVQLTNPEILTEIHKSYYDAGSNVVMINTFGANSLKYSDEELDSLVEAAVKCARKACAESINKEEKFVALDIGSIGKLLKPWGDMEFETAVEVFAKTVKLGVKHGVDLIVIETMNDSYETKAALLAAKENSGLPVFVTNAYDITGKLMTGASPEAMVAMLEGMGADAIGANCSCGPKELKDTVRRLLAAASVPVIVKPNAGLPREENGQTIFDVDPEEFSELVAEFVESGATIVGGCCGTSPEYIKALYDKTSHIIYNEVKQAEKNISVVSSYAKSVEIGNDFVLIGERINPTGKKKFKEALRSGDINYILKEGISQEEHGAHILDVNVGLPEINEEEMLTRVVYELQSVTSLPLQLDTSDFTAMESALRLYNGKAMINSVNGKAESMEKVFPLVKKYGGVCVALTLDDNGIPTTVEGRVEIAKRILKVAESYGIKKKDLIFDTLAMAVSADPKSADVTIGAVKALNEMGLNTSLGVSNISFGLPNRETVNVSFLTSCLDNGLSAAIMNVYSDAMVGACHSWRALHGRDEGFRDYTQFFADKTTSAVSAPVAETQGDLKKAIENGLSDAAKSIAKDCLLSEEPLDIINNKIIPALDTVGRGFENKTVFLPGLLMSAEAAKAAFEVVGESFKSESREKKCKIVLATVKGDIHDIGKNIVRLLLESYGFEVIDLGKDVPKELVLSTVKETGAPLVGLSALMTTTVSSMEDTIKLLHEEVPKCKIVVGGAVMTREYAEKIGADVYSKDAMETVRYAEEINSAI